MNASADRDITTQEIHTLLIEGSKYSASEDVEKAAKCYAHVLDLQSQDPQVYILLARCLYRLGLKRNDIFGGNEDEGDEDEGADESESEEEMSGEDNEDANGAAKQELNSKLYQFGHVEDDECDTAAAAAAAAAQSFEDSANASTYVDARGESLLLGLQKQQQEAQEDDEEQGGNQTDMSIGEGFDSFLQGNLFENSLELLYRARIMYMEPQNESKSVSELSRDTQLRLAELYDLLGDIGQELEDFTQAVRDYEEALKFYGQSLAPEERGVLIDTYVKLSDALRWSDPAEKDSPSREQRLKHLQELQRLIRSRIEGGNSKDAELDQQHLERLIEDEELLKSDRPRSKNVLTPELMAQSIFKQVLGVPQKSINDLSRMVKKKKNKLTKRHARR